MQHKDNLLWWAWLILKRQQAQNNGVNILGGSSSFNKPHHSLRMSPQNDLQWVGTDQDQNGGVRRIQSEAL